MSSKTFFSPVAVLALSWLTYKISGKLIRNALFNKLSCFNELPLLGIPRPNNTRIPGTAVIAGGSISGLMAARVCSDHFENVLIIEPDAWLIREEAKYTTHRDKLSGNSFVNQRSRVIQWPSLHALNYMLYLALERLVPNIDLEIEKAGGRRTCADDRLHMVGCAVSAPHHHYPKNQFPRTFALSRSLFEACLRKWFFAGCKNLKQTVGTVVGVTCEDDTSSRINAVRVKLPDGEEISVPAALVVDCTGTAHAGARWLNALPNVVGNPKAKDTSIAGLKSTYDAKVLGANFEFNVPDPILAQLEDMGAVGMKDGSNVYISGPYPGISNRALFIFRLEKNYLCINAVWVHDSPKHATITDLRENINAMNMVDPLPAWVFPMLDIFEAEGVPFNRYRVRDSACSIVQYHLAQRIPSNFVAVGDAYCHVNPIRGQGIGKLTVDVVSLNAVLQRNATAPRVPQDFQKQYFAITSGRTAPVWDANKEADYGWDTTVPVPGEDPARAGAFMRKYMSQFFTLCFQDKEISARFWYTLHWLAPPTDFFAPVVLRKLLWMNIKWFFGFPPRRSLVT